MILIILFYLYLSGVVITALCIGLTLNKNDFKGLSIKEILIDFSFIFIAALGSWITMYYIFKN